MQETWVQFWDQEDFMEEGMAICSSILAWKIPGWKSLAGYSPQSCKEADMTDTTERTRSAETLNKQGDNIPP